MCMVLLDSGAQYAQGTTDVTRTFHLGQPTEWQRECFTRVLKGNIGLDTCVFPVGTPGMAIDAFARNALWQVMTSYLLEPIPRMASYLLEPIPRMTSHLPEPIPLILAPSSAASH